MDAHETLRIQSLLEPTQREVQHVARTRSMGDDAITARLEPRNVRDQQRNEVASRSHEESADRTIGKRAH